MGQFPPDFMMGPDFGPRGYMGRLNDRFQDDFGGYEQE